MSVKADIILRIEKRIEAGEAQLPELTQEIRNYEANLARLKEGLAHLLMRREGIVAGIASDRELLSGSVPKQERRKKTAVLIPSPIDMLSKKEV